MKKAKELRFLDSVDICVFWKLGNDCIENHKEFSLLLMPSDVLDIVEVFLEIVLEI